MATFTAKYPGPCMNCSTRILPGDEVIYVDDELQHAHCDDDFDEFVSHREPDICRRCFMVLPVVGSCDCED